MIGTTGPQVIRNSIMVSEDGVHFVKTHHVLHGPWAGGAYRPEAFTDSGLGTMPEWGVEMADERGKSDLPFLRRFDLQQGET
jgi:hypothetical protein